LWAGYGHEYGLVHCQFSVISVNYINAIDSNSTVLYLAQWLEC